MLTAQASYEEIKRLGSFLFVMRCFLFPFVLHTMLKGLFRLYAERAFSFLCNPIKIKKRKKFFQKVLGFWVP